MNGEKSVKNKESKCHNTDAAGLFNPSFIIANFRDKFRINFHLTPLVINYFNNRKTIPRNNHVAPLNKPGLIPLVAGFTASPIPKADINTEESF